MASQALSIRLDGILQLQAGVTRGIGVLRRPFAAGRGRKCLTAVRRKCKGSVAEQFSTQTFIGGASPSMLRFKGGASYRWERTKKFGKRDPGPGTMIRTGAYRTAWLGGSGRFESISDTVITWGVDEGLFPQVGMHQKGGVTTIKADPSHRTRKGFLAMQIKLLYLTGIFFGERFLLERGFRVQPRGIGLNPGMASAVIKILSDAFYAAVKGKAQPGGSTP